jgi:hypothetical protein
MPDLRANRLNIDTGVAHGGPLTAAVFVREQINPVTFIQTTEQGGQNLSGIGLVGSTCKIVAMLRSLPIS